MWLKSEYCLQTVAGKSCYMQASSSRLLRMRVMVRDVWLLRSNYTRPDACVAHRDAICTGRCPRKQGGCRRGALELGYQEHVSSTLTGLFVVFFCSARLQLTLQQCRRPLIEVCWTSDLTYLNLSNYCFEKTKIKLCTHLFSHKIQIIIVAKIILDNNFKIIIRNKNQNKIAQWKFQGNSLERKMNLFCFMKQKTYEWIEKFFVSVSRLVLFKMTHYYWMYSLVAVAWSWSWFHSEFYFAKIRKKPCDILICINICMRNIVHINWFKIL